MEIEDNLKSTRSLGLMAIVNKAASDDQGRDFTLTLWFKSGAKYEGFRAMVPDGGYTMQDMVIGEHDIGHGAAFFIWDDISGIIVNWKNK
jgi:hypothetical protein